MSDLISRGALIEALQKEEKKCEARMIMPSWYSAMKVIREQTTAYDVDKVVEELEKRQHIKSMSQEFRLSGSESYYEAKYKAEAFEEAIEIVKGGGVNERD